MPGLLIQRLSNTPKFDIMYLSQNVSLTQSISRILTVINEVLRLKGTHYVIVTKCLPHPKYKQNLNSTNEVLRLKGTPHDTL